MDPSVGNNWDYLSGTYPGDTLSAPAVGIPAGGGANFLSGLGGAGNLASVGALGAGVAGAGIGAYNLFGGGGGDQLPAAVAGPIQSMGLHEEQDAYNLTRPLIDNQLPAPFQAVLDQQTQSAEAGARSNAASKGVSADPNMNTQLASQLGMLEQQKLVNQANIESQLYSQGLQTAGLATQNFNILAQAQAAQQQAQTNAISSFAQSLGMLGAVGAKTAPAVGALL